jgi:hypothetical protein
MKRALMEVKAAADVDVYENISARAIDKAVEVRPDAERFCEF